MSNRPEDVDRIFRKLSRKYNTPKRVQDLVRGFDYNGSHPETLRSAIETYRAREAHCLEAAFLAAAILEHQGHPPLVLVLESVDLLDHVLFVFKEKTGWGAIGRSRQEGLHGRSPRFRSLKELAWSYFDPFIDRTGRVVRYQVTDLDRAGRKWRYSPKNVWSVEDYLNGMRYIPLPSSDRRYRKFYRRFLNCGEIKSGRYWW